jgi:methyl-accepting chemotaxis protein
MGEIRTSIADTTSAIKNVYSIGNEVNTEIDEFESKMHEIGQLIIRLNSLNSENSQVIHELNAEMEKFILPAAEGTLVKVDL